MLADCLNLVDQARGVAPGDMSAPQAVLCSSRHDTRVKWILMEHITKMPFPTKEYRAAVFPIEYTFRHTSGPRQIIVTVQPHESRSAEERELSRGYFRVIDDFSKLPSVIRQVTRLLRPDGLSGKSSFVARDALRIEVTGPHNVNLSVVDLPGLGSAPGGEKWNEDDRMLWEIAESYLTNPATLVLGCYKTDGRTANRPVRRLIAMHKQHPWKCFIRAPKEKKRNKIHEYRMKLVLTLLGSDTGRDLYCCGLSAKSSARRHYDEVKRAGRNLRQVFGLESIRTRINGSSGWEKLD